MSIFNEFNKKEKPVFTGITRGVGGFGLVAVVVEVLFLPGILLVEALKYLILIHLTDAHITYSHLTITLLLPHSEAKIQFC